jgi:hypothetical protein
MVREAPQAVRPPRTTFGDPFSFGVSLKLNSQPQADLPRQAAVSRAHGRTAATAYHRGTGPAVASRVSTTTVQKPVGGYGVTPPGAPLMRTVATSPIPSSISKSDDANLERPLGTSHAREQRQREQQRASSGGSAGTNARRDATPAAASPTVAFGGRPPKRSACWSMGPRQKPTRESLEQGPGPASYYLPLEYDYFTAPPSQLMAPQVQSRRLTRTHLPPHVLCMEDLDAVTAGGGGVGASAAEDACASYEQPPARKQVGPAFSFGVKPPQSQSTIWAGPGKDSPGPAAYDEVVRGHVPATTFGKPPRGGGGGGKDGGGGVWGGGSDRSEEPAPGEASIRSAH